MKTSEEIMETVRINQGYTVAFHTFWNECGPNQMLRNNFLIHYTNIRNWCAVESKKYFDKQTTCEEVKAEAERWIAMFAPAMVRSLGDRHTVEEMTIAYREQMRLTWQRSMVEHQRWQDYLQECRVKFGT